MTLSRVTTSGTATAPPQQSLVHHHDFRRLWAGDAVSALGVQLVGLALPIMAVRLLGADEFQMGLLGTFEFLAFLVVGLPAGAWVDRWRKKRVIMVGDLVRAAFLLSLPAAWMLDSLTMTQVYVVALVVGTATVFFDVAHQSYLPEIVPATQIGEGNAKLMAMQQTASIAGPALGATLIRLVGAPFTIAATAVSMAASVLFVWRIRHAEEAPAVEDRRPLRTEIWEGLSFVLHQTLLRRIVTCTALSNFFASIASVLLVLFVIRDLGLNEATLGLVLSVGAVGGLVGALTVTRISKVLGEGRTIPAMALLTAPFAALTPLATQLPPVPALAIGSFGVAYGAVGYNVIQVSFRQRLCPRHLLGRMNASIRFIVWGLMPIGAFIGGVLGETIGVVPTLWLAAGGFLLAGLTVLFSPLSRMRDLPRELDVLSDTTTG
ncbi:MAG TPA: MFS transporter [Nocardioidaceae bacterium]|nr:MFS transporter [Nocardioidaceae bacterium]